jgi:hypothetical protein
MPEKETVGTESAAAPVEATPHISTDAYYIAEELTGDIAAGINIPCMCRLHLSASFALVCSTLLRV